VSVRLDSTANASRFGQGVGNLGKDNLQMITAKRAARSRVSDYAFDFVALAPFHDRTQRTDTTVKLFEQFPEI
jgi:hypothetical protein